MQEFENESEQIMVPAQEALQRLATGNARFVAGKATGLKGGVVNPADYAQGQDPFAVILGCSDSRVPVEFIFDQGFGDLFVVRVAGNIAASSQVGSIEFAAEKFQVRLVVVLGHSMCGAVLATLDAMLRGIPAGGGKISSVVDRIRPAVEPLLRDNRDPDPEALVKNSVRANIVASADYLRKESPILSDLVSNEDLLIVGAEYCLESGKVVFFHGVPEGYSP
jgi:carbonic anhydrase